MTFWVIVIDFYINDSKNKLKDNYVLKKMRPNFILQLMTEDCLPDCQKLREQIGWNQLLADWQRFFNLNPSGCFIVKDQEKIVGTVCTVIYEQSGWVAMVIVDSNYRRMGIGKMLLMAGIQHLEEKGLTVRLDATPEGKMLYDTIGFQDEYHEARLECHEIQSVPYEDTKIKKLSANLLDELNDFDRSIFGESRKNVLESYLHHYPDYAFYVEDGGKISGYILARNGSRAFHIGPWVALNKEDAQNLFLHCVTIRKPDCIFVDIAGPNPHVFNMLTNYGFEQQRPFIRMYKGNKPNPGKPEFIYGLSGPELG